jgi:EmrB/QacA subfamily drug resistance transporter
MKEKWILYSLASCMFLSSIGTSIPNVALPTLAQSFSVTFSEIQWVIISYLLANTVSIVTVGRIGDIFGRKKILLTGLILFSLSAFLCGISNSLYILLFGRILQGLSSAILMSLSIALISDFIPKAKMGRAMGLLGTSSAIGTASGPSVGGFILAAFGWEFIFYFMALLGIISAVILFLTFPKSSNEENDRKLFDILGALFLSLTLLFFSLSISSSTSFEVSCRFILILFSVLSGVLFFFHERKVHSPLVAFNIFKERNLANSLIMNICVSTVMMSTLVVGPFYLSKTLNLEIRMVGAVMTVGPLVSIISGIIAGRVMDFIGPSKMIVMGLLQIFLGAICFSLLPGMFGVAGYIISSAVLSPGYQMFQTANNSLVMIGSSNTQRGVISGILSLSRNIGLITGTSIMGAIFFTRGMQMTFFAASAFALLALLLSIKINSLDS